MSIHPDDKGPSQHLREQAGTSAGKNAGSCRTSKGMASIAMSRLMLSHYFRNEKLMRRALLRPLPITAGMALIPNVDCSNKAALRCQASGLPRGKCRPNAHALRAGFGRAAHGHGIGMLRFARGSTRQMRSHAGLSGGPQASQASTNRPVRCGGWSAMWIAGRPGTTPLSGQPWSTADSARHDASGKYRAAGPPLTAISLMSELEMKMCAGSVSRKIVSTSGAMSMFAKPV